MRIDKKELIRIIEQQYGMETREVESYVRVMTRKTKELIYKGFMESSKMKGVE